VVPSLPVTVTCVAFVADTVNVEAPPAAIVEGLAITVIVGAGLAVTVTVVVAVIDPPLPDAAAV
jgi:hypothetical protein